MPKYRLYYEDGSEAGEARYAVYLSGGETITAGEGRTLRVLEIVPNENDADPYAGLLKVEAA